jgi:glycosyltransferase involved in cell wall biosynthesis
LAAYLANADILVSPRLKGRNTPMKIYSYLQSGKAILATNLETHTQILDERVAVLENPAPEAFSKGLRRLMKDQALRSKLGSSAKKMFEEKFSYDHFSKKLKALYNEVESDLQPRRRQNRA